MCMLNNPKQHQNPLSRCKISGKSQECSSSMYLFVHLSVQFEAAEEEDDADADKKPSRKQKSLGLLCQKFLALYPDYPSPHSPIWISLDEVATSLGESP